VAVDDEASLPLRVVSESIGPDGVRPNGALEARVVRPVEAFVADLDATVIATSEVDLDGRRNFVRSQATNEGNLIGDALLWQANALAADFGVEPADLAIQNGGGIRNDSIIPAGDITELDTFDMLPFPNFVTISEDLSRERVKELLEHAVSCAVGGDPAYGGADSCGSGRFAQVGGIEFTWDATGTQQQLDELGVVTQPGTRVVEATLADGTPIVVDGAVVPGPVLRVATIDFLARGGDQYPYRDTAFTVLGASYQQALSNYLQAAVADGGLGGLITADDYPEGGGDRIARLN
jgi:5'-nucleotidase